MAKYIETSPGVFELNKNEDSDTMLRAIYAWISQEGNILPEWGDYQQEVSLEPGHISTNPEVLCLFRCDERVLVFEIGTCGTGIIWNKFLSNSGKPFCFEFAEEAEVLKLDALPALWDWLKGVG